MGWGVWWAASVWVAWVVPLSSPLQVRLVPTDVTLPPHLAMALLPDHTPPEYRVLRWVAGRDRREVQEAGSGTSLPTSSLSLHLPVGDAQVDLTLRRTDIATQDLKLGFNGVTGVEDQEKEVPHNCFYSGGFSSSWAVVSTCDGLVGLLQHNGRSYQVEEVEVEVKPGKWSRERREAASPLVVVFALTSHIAPESALPPAVPDLPWPEDEGATSAVAYTESLLDPSASTLARAGRTRRRAARTAKGPNTVELAVFLDQKLYSYIKKRYPGHNQDDMSLQIVMTLVNAVHRVYNDASLGNRRLKMLVKKVEVLGNGKVAKAKGDIYKYLRNFCRYQSGRNTRGGMGWDHALLLSAEDLWNKDPRKNSTVGLAYMGGMCSPLFSCTVNEATSFAAAYIIAHEMGHNLNMVHDGQGATASCLADKYIMAPVMASGATTWSECSKRSLSRFLQTRGGCLTKDNTHGATTGVGTHEGAPPGQRFDADEQCHYMYGKEWSHFTNSQAPFNEVCREIWCRKGRLLRTPLTAALDGTACGRNKVCQSSRCMVKKFKSRRISQEEGNKKRGKRDKKKNNKNKKKNKVTRKENTKSKTRKNKVSKLNLAKKYPRMKKKVKIGLKPNKKKQKKQNHNNKKGFQNGVKSKTKIYKKIPKKFRRIETPGEIIIKERLKYVPGKGWKIKIIRIKKRKRIIENLKNKNKKQRNTSKKKKNVKCNNKESKCKIVKPRNKAKHHSNKSSQKIGGDGNDTRNPSKEIKKIQNLINKYNKYSPFDISKYSRTSVKIKDGKSTTTNSSSMSCQPQKVKYVTGRGWWVKVPIRCVKPSHS